MAASWNVERGRRRRCRWVRLKNPWQGKWAAAQIAVGEREGHHVGPVRRGIARLFRPHAAGAGTRRPVAGNVT